MPRNTSTTRARTRTTALLAALVALGAAASATAAPATARVVPDRLLVKFRGGVDRTDAARILAAAGARNVRTIRAIGVHVVRTRAAQRSSVRAALQRRSDVRFAEPDGRAAAQETVPNDPFFPQGSYAISAGAWGWYRSHTTQAWDLTTGDPGVVVAILDTGLKTQGGDFDGQVVSPHNVLTGSTDVGSSLDNHGTYVAGAAGLAMNNGAGNAGYCPGCRIMPVQISSGGSAAYSDMATGITWAADHGAQIENLSWAGTTSSSTLASAVSYARSKGVVVFAAAGNSNCDCPTYPSSTPGVLGVGGVAQSGAKAGDSNYGTWVALAAPEGNMTAWPAIGGAPGFAPVGGTSLASPAAAGIAALVRSAKPAMTGSELEQTLESSASPASFTVRYGELDAMASLRTLGLSDPQPAGAPVNANAPAVLTETNGDQNVAPLTRAPQAGDVLVRGQGAWTGSSPLALSSVRWYRCSPDGTGCISVGSSWKYTVQSPDTGYALKLTIGFADPDGTTSASAPLTGAVGGTATTGSPPANTALPAITGTAQEGASLTASNGSWSGSPTSYAYRWQRCDSSGAGCGSIAGATGQSYAPTAGDAGSTIRVVVTAANAYGSGSATSNATAVVAAASAPQPVTTTLTGSISSRQPSQGFNLGVGGGSAAATLTFNKASSMTLTLLAPDGSTVASATGSSGLQLNRTLAAGTYRYVVSGSVSKGSASFTLSVKAPAP